MQRAGALISPGLIVFDFFANEREGVVGERVYTRVCIIWE